MNIENQSNTTQLRDNMLTIVSANLAKLLEQHATTQKRLSELTDTAPATINSYINGKSLPNAEFLVALKNLYDISVDDFLTKSINPEDFLPASKVASNSEADKQHLIAQKYLGTYFIYYFDTSHYKGRDFNTAEESLKYGILHIYEDSSPVGRKTYSCIAVFCLDTIKQAENIKKKIESLEDCQKIIEYIATNYPVGMYHGSFDLGDKFVYLSMDHGERDKALAIFYKVDSNKKLFRGGLGTINSISKGRSPMPTLQFLGISRDKILLSAEEIQHALLLHHPTFKVRNEADELIALIKKLFIDDKSSDIGLTDLQKSVTVRANMERYITTSMKNNQFRYQKASDRDDDEWYHLLKHETDVPKNKYF